MLAAQTIAFLESPLLTSFVCLLSMLAGLFAGSFAHLASWRITLGPSLGGGARCHVCGHPLSLYESLPLLGWWRVNGICPYCHRELGMDKPLCELLCAFMFVSVVLRHGISIVAVEVMAAITVLLIICLCALRDYRIPNKCIIYLLLIRLLYLAVMGVMGEDVVALLLASCVGAVSLSVLLALAVFLSNAMLARDVTGMGTVKLVAVVGFYLGWQQGVMAVGAAAALWLFVWVVSPRKVLEVEVEGGPHREDDPYGDDDDLSPQDLRASLEEDIAEPMRLIPFAPPVAISLWIMLLLGVAPGMWNAPII